MAEQGHLLEDVQVDARRSKKRRKKDDYYRTPSWMTVALLRRIHLPVGCRVMCPCVGDGAIVRDLWPYVTVVTNDIVQRDPVVPDFLLDATLRESWDAFEQLGPIHVTLENPTFAESFAIIAHAIERSRDGVILLNRCTWPEPTEERDEWMAAHPPSAQIRLPRWNFRSIDGKGGSDSAHPSWFVWNLGATLIAPGEHIVTRRERNALIAAEKIRRHSEVA